MLFLENYATFANFSFLNFKILNDLNPPSYRMIMLIVVIMLIHKVISEVHVLV